MAGCDILKNREYKDKSAPKVTVWHHEAPMSDAKQ